MTNYPFHQQPPTQHDKILRSFSSLTQTSAQLSKVKTINRLEKEIKKLKAIIQFNAADMEEKLSIQQDEMNTQKIEIIDRIEETRTERKLVLREIPDVVATNVSRESRCKSKDSQLTMIKMEIEDLEQESEEMRENLLTTKKRFHHINSIANSFLLLIKDLELEHRQVSESLTDIQSKSDNEHLYFTNVIQDHLNKELKLKQELVNEKKVEGTNMSFADVFEKQNSSMKKMLYSLETQHQVISNMTMMH